MSVQPMCHACHADDASRDGCVEHAHLPGHDYHKPTGTQTERVVAYIRTHPGCTTMEITLALSPFVSNPRARISDARAHGFVISKVKDEFGVWRFRVVSARPAPLTGRQTSLAL